MKTKISLALLITALLTSTEVLAHSDDTLETIVVMLPALLVGAGILGLAYLIEKIGLSGLSKVVGIIGLIIGGLAVAGIAFTILAAILSFVGMVLDAAFTLAFYVGAFLLACYIIYSIFNWLFTPKS
jgi:hypothetical protein